MNVNSHVLDNFIGAFNKFTVCVVFSIFFYNSHRRSADVLRQNVSICIFEASEVEMFSSSLWHRMPCYFHGCQLSVYTLVLKLPERIFTYFFLLKK